ncbi:hypothetical protein METBIDRAFT_47952 [Metschnikowia bicuspidata var. bicuspidata NRRL YB-4993]|uniref:Enhancer of mRNA-decapping protein 1 n=1 Tax=Metschnikowia bicuspidata var. bicuspidata NRRL YB-4993 TaxID=869754 RepID=A0A1A0GZ64_9ASCO|nr:hypothetical protein METBIDRAFT_47952 [Metschnikowia bicuspidata var. bicuspidata NRRL YB-4993]OBA17018.1 hypothetical protein METBIDRAFT_47952 [Metschnikowia bicuspidata var. bicuspidata NRRL YB-4993]
MAHEIPLQVHHKALSGTKTRKHKPVNQAKSQLPNGQKPDFGSGLKEKPLKGRSPQLPNGEKPDFGGSDHKKDHGSKPNGSRKTRKASGKKTSTVPTTPISSNEPRKSEGKECYAGSSFHSSPEALALPKPSFARNSPQAPSTGTFSPLNQPPVNAVSHDVAMPHAFVYQGMPPSGPPRHPVTAYPPSPLPGFAYNTNRQGYINYLYPPAAIPQPPLPLQSIPFQNYPVPQPPSNQQFGGQKITFNELMGSSH